MRASRAPEKWQLVLDAINDDNYKLANKLAVKYNFASKVNKEKNSRRYTTHTIKGRLCRNGPRRQNVLS